MGNFSTTFKLGLSLFNFASSDIRGLLQPKQFHDAVQVRDLQCYDKLCDLKGTQFKAPTEMWQGVGGQAGVKSQCRFAGIESEYSELEGIHRDCRVQLLVLQRTAPNSTPSV